MPRIVILSPNTPQTMSLETQFQQKLTSQYCSHLTSLQTSPQHPHKFLLENEIYQEVDNEILFQHVDELSFRLSQIFQMHLPYLTQSKKLVNHRKFLQTGVVDMLSQPGSMDIFINCIIERLFEVPCWLPNHLRGKPYYNVNWQHWLRALFNASERESLTTPPKPPNKKLRQTTLELYQRPYVEWKVCKIWHCSGIKVRREIPEGQLRTPRTPFDSDFLYFCNKKTDVEKYGWRVFTNFADAESIIQNCDMKRELEGRRMMVDTWNSEEEKKQKRSGSSGASSGSSSGRDTSNHPPHTFSRKKLAKKYRNGPYTLEFGKDTSTKSFEEIFYSDKKMDMRSCKMNFR